MLLSATLFFLHASTAVAASDTVWVEDAVPAGATTGADGGDSWSWVSSNPTQYAGTVANQSAVVVGAEHQHYFYNATATLSVATGESLFAYVYLDTVNPPSEVVLQWNDGTWEHRAYWGANLIAWGTDGTVSLHSMGALPATGQWVRLEVAASAVGLEGRVLNGMAFSLYGGRATWDHAGKSSAPGALTVTLTTPTNGATYNAPTTTVDLAATAEAGSGSISKVEFYRDGVLIGTDTTAPYTYSDASVPMGVYSYTAKAYDALANVTSTAAAVTVNRAVGSTNVALAANGGVATASSTYSSDYTAPAANNDERTGAPWNNNGYWNDNTSGTFPDWLQIAFSGTKTINEIDVYSVQENYNTPSTPTYAMTCASYCLKDFQVQYWNGASWVDVTGGNVTNNNKVWRQFYFSAVSTDRIRVYVNATPDSWSRITEVEAWTGAAPTVTLTAPANGASYTAPATVNLAATATAATGSISKVEFYRDGVLIATDTTAPYTYSDANVPISAHSYTAIAYDDSANVTSAAVAVTVAAGVGSTNVALQANGGVATADGYVASYYPTKANDGNRANGWYGWWGAFSGVAHWLQVTFAGTKTIGEIDVLMTQDNWGSPSTPTLVMTCVDNCPAAFEVQYWNGAAWVDVTGGNVSGNDKVWRQFIFSAISTDRIRVLVNTASFWGYTMLQEVEAWEAAATSTLHHFTINIGGAAGSTCAAKSITITAQAADNSTVTSYTGTVTLSTASAHGDWAIVAGAGTLNNGTADDGAATYAFAAGDNGVVTLSLTDTHADDLTITAVDGAVSSTSAGINFRDNVFVISATDALGTTVVAGRDHAMKAELWKKDAGTGNCAVDAKYTGSHNLDAWYVADADHPAGASNPVISSGTPPATCGVAPSDELSTSVPAINAGSNILANVPFVNGVWNFCLTTADVGKYAITLRDDTRAYATASDISGTSGTLTVRPFGIAIHDVKKGGSANPGGTATTGSKFIPAGNTAQAAAQFQATVTGYLWDVADDANNDGVPDGGANLTNNSAAPHFDWGTTLSAASTAPYFTPAAGALGTLSGTTTITKGSFSSGSATVSNLAYSEVGSFSMQAALTNYLNTSGVNLSGVNVNNSGAATYIGRFYPDHFTLTASSLTAACVAGGFTYMDHANLGVAYTLEARNSADVKTGNYGAGYTTGSVSVVAENADSGSDLSSRLTIASGSWASGSYAVNTSVAKLSRSASPNGPYDSLQLGVQVSDPDGAVLASRDMNTSTSGACGGACTAKALGDTTKLRFGRLRLWNASGSQLITMPVPFETQYWNGSAFVTNTADSCTAIVAGNIALGNYQKTVAENDTTVSVSSALAAGRGTLRLTAPGGAKMGSVDVSVNLTGAGSGASCTAGMASSTGANLGHLQGGWCGSAYVNDPTARATFGIYRNSGAITYQRENF